VLFSYQTELHKNGSFHDIESLLGQKLSYTMCTFIWVSQCVLMDVAVY